jgi:hypothetical protein
MTIWMQIWMGMREKQVKSFLKLSFSKEKDD